MLYFCESISDDASTWLVEKLKHLFLHYHQDLNIIDQVVEYMPSKQRLQEKKLFSLQPRFHFRNFQFCLPNGESLG